MTENMILTTAGWEFSDFCCSWKIPINWSGNVSWECTSFDGKSLLDPGWNVSERLNPEYPGG